MGSFMALVFTLILYVPRKILDFTTFCSCFVDGFKQMASAIFILCLAWTLSGVCGEDYLNIGGYVGGVVSGNQTVAIMLPRCSSSWRLVSLLQRVLPGERLVS